MDETINIALVSDKNYFQPLSVVITSILKNASGSDKLNFIILCNQVPDELKNKIKELKTIKDFSINFMDLNSDKLKNFDSDIQYMCGGGCEEAHSHITKTTYSRMYLADILPELDKLIYLDCDLIIKTSLKELYDIDLNENYIAGVEDIGCTYLGKYWKNVFPYDYFCINTGVLLINLKKWREDKIVQKLLEAGKQGKYKLQLDQELINDVCHEKVIPLDLSWNVQDSFYRNDKIVKTNKNKKYIKYCAKHPKIIHYTEKIKPWKNVLMAKSNEWWYYNQYSSLKAEMTLQQKIKYHLRLFYKIFVYEETEERRIYHILFWTIKINKKNVKEKNDNNL